MYCSAVARRKRNRAHPIELDVSAFGRVWSLVNLERTHVKILRGWVLEAKADIRHVGRISDSWSRRLYNAR